MVKSNINLIQFEILDESSTGILINGFSIALHNLSAGIDEAGTNDKCTVNNCHGGNCIAGCNQDI